MFRLGVGGGGDGAGGRICGSESRSAAVYAIFGDAGISELSPPFYNTDMHCITIIEGVTPQLLLREYLRRPRERKPSGDDCDGDLSFHGVVHQGAEDYVGVGIHRLIDDFSSCINLRIAVYTSRISRGRGGGVTSFPTPNLLQGQVVASNNIEHHSLGLLDGEVQQG